MPASVTAAAADVPGTASVDDNSTQPGKHGKVREFESGQGKVGENVFL